MPRIPPLAYEDASPEARAAHDEGVDAYGRMTNMKRTLLHSLPAYRALMEWYPLRDTVLPFLGERLTYLFSHAISDQTDCLICTTYMRRVLIDAGDDPENFELNEREQLVVDFGRALAKQNAFVPDDLYRRLAKEFTDEQIVALTTFGALMLATNVFNNALEVDLDEYLYEYTAEAAAKRASS